MTVTDVQKDPEALIMTVRAEFNAPSERVWELWSDPRQLERWWGPPTYPATVVDHDLNVGGRVSYFMTSPEGEKFHGWWRVIAADAPRRLEFEDGFADDAGQPNPDRPTTIIEVTFADQGDGGTAMTIQTQFPSLAAMEQMAEMGMEEGIRAAMGQMDDILAAV